MEFSYTYFLVSSPLFGTLHSYSFTKIKLPANIRRRLLSSNSVVIISQVNCCREQSTNKSNLFYFRRKLSLEETIVRRPRHLSDVSLQTTFRRDVVSDADRHAAAPTSGDVDARADRASHQERRPQKGQSPQVWYLQQGLWPTKPDDSSHDLLSRLWHSQSWPQQVRLQLQKVRPICRIGCLLRRNILGLFIPFLI